MSLPSGLYELSKNEVRKDIRDIERTIPEDSDSDCSFKSDEILGSAYPVKPRKAPKSASKGTNKEAAAKIDALVAKEGQASSSEHALNFVRAIRFSRNELHIAEEKRERMEVLNNVRTGDFSIFTALS